MKLVSFKISPAILYYGFHVANLIGREGKVVFSVPEII